MPYDPNYDPYEKYSVIDNPFGTSKKDFSWVDGNNYSQVQNKNDEVIGYKNMSIPHNGWLDTKPGYGVLTSLPGQAFIRPQSATSSVDPVAANAAAFNNSVKAPSWYQAPSSQASASQVPYMPGAPGQQASGGGPFAYLQNFNQHGTSAPGSAHFSSAAQATAPMPGMGSTRGVPPTIPLLSGGGK